MSETYETIQRRPEYIEEREQALIDKIFGNADANGVYTGGLIDAEEYPDLFKIPEYKIAGESDLEKSVYNSFDTDEERQSFMDRYQPYFMDETGEAKYFPDAESTMGTGVGEIEGAITDYFPDAENYITGGTEAFDPSTGVADYMNPYKQSVIDEAMKQIDKQGAQAMQKMNAQAVGAGAFGGSRAGVQAAETQGNIQDARISMVEWEKINETLFSLLGRYCKKTASKVAKDASRDLWLDADASLKYGIIDEIILKQ